MNKTQSGFTLIELVAVIAILGILAATALPRFVDLSTEAKTSAKAGVVGGLNAAVALVHSKWLAQGGGASVTMDGGSTVTINNVTGTTGYGYPDVGGTAYTSDPTCTALVGALLSSTNGLTATYTSPNCIVSGSFGTATLSAMNAS